MIANRWRRRVQRSFNYSKHTGLLSTPQMEKKTEVAQNELYSVAASCMQGWRINMEDAYQSLIEMPQDPSSSFFGVFDGHGGDAVANYVAEKLHLYLQKRPEYKTNPTLALQLSFIDLDLHLMAVESIFTNMVGCTATVVLIKGSKMYCANAGDSRAIASVSGRVESLSVDHKPNNQREARRILDAGGWIEGGRINGSLAVSRAFGDSNFKRNPKKKPHEQMVTASPDVIIFDINDSWEFIILATDGIWDVMSNAQVLEFCRNRLADSNTPADICEDLLSLCLSKHPDWQGVGTDNMTVILICFLKSKFYREISTGEKCDEQDILPTRVRTLSILKSARRSSLPTGKGSISGRILKFFLRNSTTRVENSTSTSNSSSTTS